MPTLIPDAQRQADRPGGESLKYLASMLIANCQGTEEIGSRVNFIHSAFSHFQILGYTNKGPSGAGAFNPLQNAAGASWQWKTQEHFDKVRFFM